MIYQQTTLTTDPWEALLNLSNIDPELADSFHDIVSRAHSKDSKPLPNLTFIRK